MQHGQYKLVYKKDSINDWNLGIETLLAWEIIDEGTEKKYRRLSTLRNESVHFQNKEQDLIPMSKEAIVLINEIVSDLFEMKKGKEFLIWFEVPGELYLKKDAESLPFVQSCFIPCAPLVGYKHILEGTPDFRLRILDNHTYSGEEVSDEEFVKLRNDYNKKVSGG